MIDTFFCGSCAKHRPLHLYVRARKNGVKQCRTCEDRATEGHKKAAADVVGHYPDGEPRLRKHAEVSVDRQKRKRYASGSVAKFFDKAGIT